MTATLASMEGPHTDRLQAAGELLVELGGAAAPGQLGQALELAGSSQASLIGRLEKLGHVERSKKLVRLTPAGWAKYSPAPSVGAGSVLDELLAPWPYPHQAFLELLISAIVARHHLVDRPAAGADEHLGFMALGGTGTGKSAMAKFVCAVFGWDPVQHLAFVDQETEGSIKGRRVGQPGSFTFEPSPFSGLPFVFFDELDNADEAKRRAVLPYLQGMARVRVEGHVVPWRPTTMVAANPPRRGDRYGQLREEYRRRCVVLDAGDAYQGDVLGRALRPFYEKHQPGRPLLSIDHLVPPAASLPESAREVLAIVREVLTETGQRRLPLLGLEMAALGRAALLGPDADLRTAAYATMVSYLGTIETLQGEAELRPDGWHLEAEAVRRAVASDAGVEQLAAAVARAKQHRANRHAELHRGRQRAVVEDLAVTGRRAALMAELKQLGEQLHGNRLPHAQRPAAAALRAQLAKLRERAGHQVSLEGLGDVDELGRPVRQQARELLSAVEAERRAQRDLKEQEAQSRRLERQAARRHPATGPSRADRQRMSAELTAWRVYIRDLEQLWRRKATKAGERPMDALRAVRMPDGRPLLAYEQLPTAPAPAGGAIARALVHYGRAQVRRPPGLWRCLLDERIRFPGWPNGECAELAEWGAGTRAVLEPLLSRCHAAEDEMVMRLGRAPRTGRPDLGSRLPAPVHVLPGRAAALQPGSYR